MLANSISIVQSERAFSAIYLFIGKYTNVIYLELSQHSFCVLVGGVKLEQLIADVSLFYPRKMIHFGLLTAIQILFMPFGRVILK